VRVVALIDGEHYPPVVRFALEELGREHEVLAAAFAGGTEKVDGDDDGQVYGLPVVRSYSAEAAMALAIEAYAPEAIVDLSDEPVVSSAERFRLASVALLHGVGYRGADFAFEPSADEVVARTPTLGIIGTGKRVGKTAISAHVARHLKAAGRDIVVLAMGRGGPAEPEVIHGEQVELTTEDLLALAREGVHASSDNYEDAVMSRVTTVGSRRCGGGMGGATYFGNVREAARVADALGKELLVCEGSGAAIPPVHRDAALLVVGAAQGAPYVTDYFGPYRLGLVDAVVVAGAEEPLASPPDVAATRAAVERLRPGIPCVPVTFRPRPLGDVSGRRVFFASTAPGIILPRLAAYLEENSGCSVVAASPHLSDRAALRRDLAEAAGTFDLVLTELKAAAIDVAAVAGEHAGVPVVLCDNVPVPVDGNDLDAVVDSVADAALERGMARSR
jgi:cyclic 2,3-diphosphoglycerate synthetase